MGVWGFMTSEQRVPPHKDFKPRAEVKFDHFVDGRFVIATDQSCS